MQTLYDFGNEDKSFITNHDLRNILISHYRGVTRLVKYIYFNPIMPKNLTIRYDWTDPKNIQVHDNGAFHPLIKEYVLDSIVVDAWARLVAYYETIVSSGKRSAFKESLASEETLERIEAFVADYKKLCQGNSPFMFTDVRNSVFEMIKFQCTEKKKKRKGTHSSRALTHAVA